MAMNSADFVWQVKLHARLHDPVEKALVLFRDPAGHEGGTSRALHRLLGFHELTQADLDEEGEADSGASAPHRRVFKNGIPLPIYKLVKRADWWAAAADRPQWPMELKVGASGKTYVPDSGLQVRFAERPVLIHPLTGSTIDLRTLGDTEVGDIKQRALDHISRLIVHCGAREDVVADWKRLLFTLWRFAPEIDDRGEAGTLGVFWKLLPADTRVPDHSIWDHLDLTSAFAGAFAADPNQDVALLSMTLGPVQSFIEAARSTSDLWAGSHLLSRMAWEMMRPVCEQLGPDAILFPRLRGVPQVDVWLKNQGVPAALFAELAWMKTGTDANPLFTAALPNRFVALVPASQVEALVAACQDAVRSWLQELGKKVVDRLHQEAGLADGSGHAYEQVRQQLQGFPEVHWAAVPFSLIRVRDIEKQRDLDVTPLREAMAPFYGNAPEAAAGFLASEAWKVLQKDIQWDDQTTFWQPNPGVLYPAVTELAERLLAAAKTQRRFVHTAQGGYRDTLSGEVEWLTHDPAHLQLPPGARDKVETLWTKVGKARPSWVKDGEHLGALSAIKRLWPTLFAEEVARETGSLSIGRFVVSTHAMALAWPIAQWLKSGAPGAERLAGCVEAMGVGEVALPSRLVRQYAGHPQLALAKKLPGLLDLAEDSEEQDAQAAEPAQPGARPARENSAATRTAGQVRQVVREVLAGEAGLETYYALILLDGDRMGKILSGDAEWTITYAESFHPEVRTRFEQYAKERPLLTAYAQSQRAPSPNRQFAISGALNDFSLIAARHVVGNEFMGRLIYAGGDDVLAMVPVAEALTCANRLQQVYRGVAASEQEAKSWELRQVKRNVLYCRNGFAYLNGTLMRMMGERASCSAGLVIAHHQTPLRAALRALRAAEKRAKGEGGRDAISVTLMKRSGGVTHFTSKWEVLPVVLDLVDYLRAEGVSRRAVYHVLVWTVDLPDAWNRVMLEPLLMYQFDRQASLEAAKARVAAMVGRLCDVLSAYAAECASTGRPFAWKGKLRSLLTLAEFLARETRYGTTATEGEGQP